MTAHSKSFGHLATGNKIVQMTTRPSSLDGIMACGLEAQQVPKFSSNTKLALSPCRSKQLHQNGPTRHQGPLPPCVAHSPVVIHQSAEIHPTPNWRWKTKAEGRFKANLSGGGFIVIWRCMLRRQFLELAALIGVDRLPL